MNKKLIIDITELVTWEGKLTGVPRVMNELCMRFEKQNKNVIFAKWDNIEKCLVKTDRKEVTTNQSSLIKGLKLDILSTKVFKNKKDHKKAVSFHEGDLLMVLADWHSSDINFTEELLRLHTKGVKLIQLVHDLLPIVTPQYAGHATEYVTNYAKKIYPICSSIIAVSENTKKDIAEWLSINKLKVPPIDVIRLGDDFQTVKPVKPPGLEEYGSENMQYILCVSTIEARKNHMLLYYVYKLAYSKNIILPKLIIVGRVGWHAEDIYVRLTNDPAINTNIIIQNNINDNELAWLYKNSLFSIYPSFYEGWGLPVAESIRYGKVCLSSNTSSLPEIAGDLIEYFNPFSTDECLKLIVKLMDINVLKMATKKLSKYKITSWDNTFQSVKLIIDKYEK